MLISDAVSDVSSISLKVGNEKGFGGRGIGCLLLHFVSCVELFSVSLDGAALGPVVESVNGMWCGASVSPCVSVV